MSTSWARMTCDALDTTGKADANAAEDRVCQDGETILMHKVSKCLAVNRKVLSAKPVRGAEYFPLRKFSPAFWLTTQRYLLPRTRHRAEKRPLSALPVVPSASQITRVQDVDISHVGRKRGSGKLSSHY